MKKIFVLFTAATLLFSCKRSKQEMLVNSWQAVTLENKEMDNEMMAGQHFIDTVGKNNTPEANLQLYGITNMDSMRHALQLQLDSLKDMQMNAVRNTNFTFRKNGIAILTFGGKVDSTRWYFDDKGAIMLNEIKDKTDGDKVRMEIVTLEDTLLKLKFTEKGPAGNVNSTVTFRPVTK